MEAAGAGEKREIRGSSRFFFFSFILFFFFFWFARKESQKRKSFLIGETMSNKHVIVMYTWHIAFYVNGVSKIA